MLKQVSTGLNLNFSLNKRGCFRLLDCSIFTCQRSLPSTFLFSYFAIKYFLSCLSLPYIVQVLFDLTVIICVLGEERLTVTMKFMMPLSALISCIFIVPIVIFMLGLLSKRSRICFTGISLVQNIQYIHLFVCNLCNIPQELEQRSYYRN